ncbi:MAG: undecaprenyldiphospho-muramoylpentapeptide beta-N-acetylglucosaminyltransferase [Bacteroidales bacterium]|nr:MAG: undecaprenyldiphospho-muramoylpentapeptide beta-N-acetylglucosaminyltransferase [Bacteroidales bacterium]
MKKQNLPQNRRIIISGGGTGGHIFPAIAIAQALEKRDKSMRILFVGAEDKMEMERVPAAGFEILGLPVVGLQRRVTIKNLAFPFKLIRSMKMAAKVLKDFKPHAVVGVGGYASGPVLRVAARMKIPALIQEQNSIAGITNRILARKAEKICVAYEGMEKFFPAEKIIVTGNPVRDDLESVAEKREEGYAFFELDKRYPVILIMGGSLGARTINESVWQNFDLVTRSNVQLIWQTGRLYYREAVEKISGMNAGNIRVYEFISRMDLAYASADLVISRAGAGTVAELCLVSKPAILVPSPNVTGDHQTMNARKLVSKEAAILVRDSEGTERLMKIALELVNDPESLKNMAENIGKLAVKNSADRIAEEVLNLIKE